MKASQLKVAPRENPLVPFALMKRMYAGMVESRLLEVWRVRRRGEGKRSPVEGQEACRAAVLLSLEPGDLVSDGAGAASSAWLRGTGLADITVAGTAGLLPDLGETSQRLAMTIGAATALKRAKLPLVAAIFIDAATKRSALRQALSVAASEELPMLLVVLPSTEPSSRKSIATESTRLGVPGIPVEAHDAIALCRVAQESILRARAGGGPALIECVRLDYAKRAPDPVAAMAKTLLRVGAADNVWIDGVAPALEARLKALKHERPA